ncbi:MAG: NUDIX hydrolase [Cetobacterium sp.]|uniref:NUDIX hydrolase n=1 Tax=Cetobacterium sp. TaxID=2071632 RepID=UPI003EE7BB51
MKHAAFVIFHSKTHILMNARSDGRWGFPGGGVEEGETFAQAAIRECKEEIGFTVPEDKITYVCNHLVRDGLTSHAFVMELPYNFLLLPVNDATTGKATHGHELTGVALFNIDTHNFYNMNLAPTVIEELEDVFGDRIKDKKPL